MSSEKKEMSDAKALLILCLAVFIPFGLLILQSELKKRKAFEEKELYAYGECFQPVKGLNRLDSRKQYIVTNQDDEFYEVLMLEKSPQSISIYDYHTKSKNLVEDVKHYKKTICWISMGEIDHQLVWKDLFKDKYEESSK